VSSELPFHDLANRHPGVTRAIGDSYSEAARICLDRHHVSPIEISIETSAITHEAFAQWRRTDERERGAWANETDATESGAYGVALAAVELSSPFGEPKPVREPITTLPRQTQTQMTLKRGCVWKCPASTGEIIQSCNSD
jgi:hypothetical protein